MAALFAVTGAAAVATAAMAFQASGEGTGVTQQATPTYQVQPCATPSPAQLAVARTQFVDALAEALGKSPADVDKALHQVGMLTDKSEPGPGDPPRTMVIDVSDMLGALQPAATQLGVTPQELADALKQTKPVLACGAGGAPPSKSALFDAVAERLGHGTTGAQVEAALALVKPQKAQTDVGDLATGADPKLQALADALGVSLDSLKHALETVGQQTCHPLDGNGGEAKVCIGFGIGFGMKVPPPGSPTAGH
jgi:hypothetical protein